MSKKKGDVMQRERQNFVYGNEEEGIPAVSKMESMKRLRIRSMMK